MTTSKYWPPQPFSMPRARSPPLTASTNARAWRPPWRPRSRRPWSPTGPPSRPCSWRTSSCRRTSSRAIDATIEAEQNADTAQFAQITAGINAETAVLEAELQAEITLVNANATASAIRLAADAEAAAITVQLEAERVSYGNLLSTLRTKKYGDEFTKIICSATSGSMLYRMQTLTDWLCRRQAFRDCLHIVRSFFFRKCHRGHQKILCFVCKKEW
ncbi:unnamed protein product [Heterosigma akashiwo]